MSDHNHDTFSPFTQPLKEYVPIAPEDAHDVLKKLADIKSGLPYLAMIEEHTKGRCPLLSAAECATGMVHLAQNQPIPLTTSQCVLYLHSQFHMIFLFYALLDKYGPETILAECNKIVSAGSAEETMVC